MIARSGISCHYDRCLYRIWTPGGRMAPSSAAILATASHNRRPPTTRRLAIQLNQPLGLPL